MRLRNSKERYGAISQLFHWGMAGLVLTAIYLGLTRSDFPLHKSIGITVLGLVILRLFWQRVNVAPELPAKMTKGQRRIAGLAHWLFYVLMIAMPLGGWVMANAAGHTVSFWGVYELPVIVQKDKALAQLVRKAHDLGGLIFLGAIALHALAAFYHQFILRDGLLWRMIPIGRKRAAVLNLTEEEKKLIEKAPWE